MKNAYLMKQFYSNNTLRLRHTKICIIQSSNLLFYGFVNFNNIFDLI